MVILFNHHLVIPCEHAMRQMCSETAVQVQGELHGDGGRSQPGHHVQAASGHSGKQSLFVEIVVYLYNQTLPLLRPSHTFSIVSWILTCWQSLNGTKYN